jgi:hypothetical protein
MAKDSKVKNTSAGEFSMKLHLKHGFSALSEKFSAAVLAGAEPDLAVTAY